jgi:predicted MFS family arabinose efflux permease
MERNWSAVASVALGTFVMVTSEFLPIGLLSTISNEMGVSRGQAGLMVTVPGAVAALAAPGLLLAVGHVDSRLILVTLTGLIGASNLTVALAGSFSVVLLGRVLLGLGVGGIWAYAAAIGRRLVPAEAGDSAVTMILTGISVGTVLGVPIGTLLAASLGWRTVFGLAAGAAVLVVGLQWTLLPSLTGSRPPSLRAILAVAAIPMALIGFAASALTAAGHFASYTFIEPQLTSVGQFSAHGLSWTISAYGLAGVVGTVVAGRAVRGDLRRAFAATAFLMAISIAVVGLFGGRATLSVAGVVVWGACFGAVGVCVQTWIYRAAPAAFEAGSALTVTVFQTALASGAFGGGLLVDQFGLRSAFMAGSALTLGCAVLLITTRPAVGPSSFALPSPATKGRP